MDLAPDSVANVENLTLTRDVGTFTMTEGELYLLTPVNGRIVGALFSGTGTVDYVPPTKEERAQLRRFFDIEEIHVEINQFFILFGDSTLKELHRHVQFAPAERERLKQMKIDNCLKYVSDKKSKYFRTSLMKTFLENKRNSMFYLQFNENLYNHLFFVIDPYRVEEVSLERRVEHAVLSHDTEVVNQFHKHSDYRHFIGLMNENKARVKITNYIIKSHIKRGLDYSATTTLRFRELTRGEKWWSLILFSDLTVDSAKWADGTPATFFKGKDNPVFWVRNDQSEGGPGRELTLYYQGELIREFQGWYLIRSSTGWYPRTGERVKARFDLTFTYPKALTLVSVGNLLDSSEDGGYITSHWVTPEPIRNASFNIGYYKEHTIQDERIPDVTVLMAKSLHTQLGAELASQGVLSGKNMDKRVGADVANSIYFFQQVYGKTPIKKFYATEAPHRHGYAFPGLIHLSWETFQMADVNGENAIFRAHEVAHQWWGIGVDFKTYHDQWLSEGLSDFSGLWYLQAVHNENDLYLKILDNWKEDILSARKYLLGDGQESGPIWLGYRTQSSSTEGDYSLIIYKKGAWVFHMLRLMMMDLQTLEDTRFKKMMHEFYFTYQGKKASTDDFQRLVERHFGTKMDWFFNEWIYNTVIPRYHFSYTTRKNSDNSWQVECRVRQEDVPENFKMSVPLKIQFGKDQFARVRMFVNKPDYRINFKVPKKPKDIIFNDLNSVLCEMEYEKWQK